LVKIIWIENNVDFKVAKIKKGLNCEQTRNIQIHKNKKA